MSKFELYYPAKPFIVTQGWGIYNPAYKQFGFDRHNGVDFLPGNDKKVYAPCDLIITEVGENPSAGKYVRAVTPEKVRVLDTECYVGLMFMHMNSQAVTTGSKILAGTLLGVAGSTGFSTGPHTHMAPYRLKEFDNIPENRLDDMYANQTFDPRPFWNGYYAVDAQTVLNSLQSILELLRGIFNSHKRFEYK